jgi:hypothetical protein
LVAPDPKQAARFLDVVGLAVAGIRHRSASYTFKSHDQELCMPDPP